MATETPADAIEPWRPELASAGWAAAAKPRRVALARAVLDILRKAVPESAGVRIELDVEAPTAELRADDLGEARARVRVQGPDAVARLIWPITPDALAEGFLRGDLDIDGDMTAAISVGQGMQPRRSVRLTCVAC